MSQLLGKLRQEDHLNTGVQDRLDTVIIPFFTPQESMLQAMLEVTCHSIDASPWILGSGCDLSVELVIYR